MCFAEFLDELVRQGIDLTEMQIRWAIRTKRVDPPPKDGSGRYAWGDRQLLQFRNLYRERQART